MNFIKKIYYNKYVKKSYSISNVDLVIDRMFASVNKGIYVDVGCNHPIKFNNTYKMNLNHSLIWMFVGSIFSSLWPMMICFVLSGALQKTSKAT